MKRSELLEAASQRLEHAILLLFAAGEECLGSDVEDLANRVELTTGREFDDASLRTKSSSRDAG